MTTMTSVSLRLRTAGWIAFAGPLLLASALADEPAAGANRQSAATGQGSVLTTLVYVPHDFGAPEVTQSGGARSISQADQPSVLVLAPPQLAPTFATQPTLYWYLSSPAGAPVRVTVLDLEAATVEPLLEVEIGAPPAGGVYATSLAAHGIQLEKGRSYEWSVALALNPEAPSEEAVAKTIFTVHEADPELFAKIEDAPALARAEALASAGYWYDLINLIAERIAAGDRAAPWRELRAALLDQVGLHIVAAYDRARTAAQ